MPPPPPPPAQRAVDPLIEWSTGEVATTALAEREPEPETEAAPPVQHARPDDGRFGTRSGRTRNRPPSASGRVPTIAPATPSTPSAPSDSPADRHIEVREAMPDPTLAVRAPDVVPVMPSTDVEPEARKPDTIGLPSAEMLATLVEPEPVVDHPPEPEPEPEPEGPVLTTTARITRALPVIFRRRPRKRVRRVTRVVRHIDTWSVFKVALVFNVVLYVVCLTAGVLLWNVAYTTGTIDNVEKFFEQFGWSSFEFKGGEIYHNAWIAGLFATIGLTGLAVLLATLFNLITDLVGGVRVSVLEEEVVARSATDTTIIRRRPRRERADRALAKLDQLERETAARSSTVRRGTVARFTRPASTTPASPPEP